MLCQFFLPVIYKILNILQEAESKPKLEFYGIKRMKNIYIYTTSCDVPAVTLRENCVLSRCRLGNSLDSLRVVKSRWGRGVGCFCDIKDDNLVHIKSAVDLYFLSPTDGSTVLSKSVFANRILA